VPVVCDKLVYLELQKTGCTTIGAVLSDLFGGEQLAPKHGNLPDGEAHKFVVGSVRNPWDFYVSLWSFGCQNRGELHELLTQRHWRAAIRMLPRPEPLAREILRPVSPWRRHYDPPHTPAKFRAWLERIQDPPRAREFDRFYGSARVKRVAGYATYRYCRLYAGDQRGFRESRTAAELLERVSASYLPNAMIRTEHLADDLVDALRSAGYEVGPDLEEKIRARSEERANVSSHLRYTEYYDDSSRELVGRRDDLIISKHGYSFGA